MDIPIGSRFCRLVVKEAVNNRGWLCICDCGKETYVGGHHLLTGRAKSCGCWKNEQAAIRHTTHGRSKSPEYNSWNAMRQRCYYQKHKDFSDYGGRGITVCERWRHSFAAFFEDVGPRPSPDHTIDRIDSDGNYEPGNVRWSNRFKQAQNRRFTIRVVLPDGRNVTLKQAAAFYGVDYGAARYAVNQRGEEPLAACQRLAAGHYYRTPNRLR